MRFLGSRKNKDESLLDAHAYHLDDMDEDDSSYGPAPPPPPPIASDDDEEMPEKDDPPQEGNEPEEYSDRDYVSPATTDDEEYQGGNDEEEDEESYEDELEYDDDQSLEIPPTSIVQRMVDQESFNGKRSPMLGLIGLVACCLIILATILGAGFGSGAFLTEKNQKADKQRDTKPTFDVERSDAIRGILQTLSTSKEQHMDTESAEAKAVHWLGTDPTFANVGTETAGEQVRLAQLYALAALWYSNDQQWENDEGWLEAENECEWYGITCQRVEQNGEVVDVVKGINLPFNNLGGTVPEDITLLPYLEELDLANNGIIQDIQDIDWSRMTSMKSLRLDGNEFSGSLGSVTAIGESLEILSVPGNLFGGGLPDLRALVGLKELDVEANKFGGPLPNSLASLDLEVLRLGYNEWMEGEIPGFVYSMANLKELSLRRSNRSGNLRNGIQNLGGLSILWLEDNALSGAIPDTIFSGLPNLQEFNGQGNRFAGPLPEFSAVGALQRLDLTSNSLTGPLPNISGATQLKVLRLGTNSITGFLPDTLPQLVQLEELDLSRNSMRGPLPINMGGLFNLRTLNLSANLKPEGTGFSGGLPASLGNLRNLRRLELRSNLLGGGIPENFSNLDNIMRVDLRFNMITGAIPTTVAAAWADTLQEGYFANTQLQGPIPPEVCGSELRVLEASCNLECSCCTMEC